MVTNVPYALLPAGMVRFLYILRWQIELLFKQLKSILCIHQSHTKNANRLKCQIYGKLILAVILHRIHARVNNQIWKQARRELGFDKLYKRMQKRAFSLFRLILLSVEGAILFLSEEIHRLIKYCLKSRQRSRQTTLELLESGAEYHVLPIDTAYPT